MIVEVQKWVYSKLMSLGYNVYDEVPSGADMPYIVIGDDAVIDDSDKVKQGLEDSVNIHVWSDYKGYKELKEIVDAIVSALNFESGTQDSVNIELCLLDNISVIREEDARHAIVRFKIKVKEV